jgi:hypothetical protein
MELPDGEALVFGLRITAKEGSVTPQVWEDGTDHLPRCPARHFYGDGSFCMGFGLTGPPPVTTPALAGTWWAVLRGFLELQIIASLTGVWPPQHARAHGPGAAVAEEVADWAEGLLPPGIRAALRDGTLALADTPGRVARRRSRCPCGSGGLLRNCHEPIVVEVLAVRRKQTEMEQGFWAAHAGRPCCGTMRDCPLRDESGKENG